MLQLLCPDKSICVSWVYIVLILKCSVSFCFHFEMSQVATLPKDCILISLRKTLSHYEMSHHADLFFNLSSFYIISIYKGFIRPGQLTYAVS